MNVKAVSCSATIRAAPRFFTVRRIILLIFFLIIVGEFGSCFRGATFFRDFL
jgi:hypothetical protein